MLHILIKHEPNGSNILINFVQTNSNKDSDRGRLVKSLLHVLIVCDTRVHTKLQVRMYPRLAMDVMKGAASGHCVW